MKKTFLEQLGAKLPIVQAPMAGVSTPELAAAVTNAGGLGSLGIAAMTVARASEEIAVTRRLTSGPFNVNLFCHRAPVVDPERHTGWLAYLSPHFVEADSNAPERLDCSIRASKRTTRCMPCCLIRSQRWSASTSGFLRERKYVRFGPRVSGSWRPRPVCRKRIRLR